MAMNTICCQMYWRSFFAPSLLTISTMVKELGAHQKYSSKCTMSRAADTKMQSVFKYLFCTVHLHIFLINAHKFNNTYVSSHELCKMGMVEVKGNVIGKHTNAHTLL